MPVTRWLSRLATGLLLAQLSAGAAVAYQEHPEHETYAIDRRGSDVLSTRRTVAQISSAAAGSWAGFITRHPGWTARWDHVDGTLREAMGPGQFIEMSSGASPVRVDAGNLESLSRSFLAREMFPWIPEDGHLRWVRGVAAPGQHWAHFTQEVNGVPVWQSRISLLVTDDGRVVRLVNRAYPDPIVSTSPGIPSASAVDAARADMPPALRPGRPTELVILPITTASSTEFRLTWKVEWLTDDPPGRWITFVDARDGRIIWRFNDVRNADITGRVSGDIEPVTSGDPYIDLPLRHVFVAVINPDLSTGDALTDAGGQFQVTTPGTVDRTLRAALAGPYGVVMDASDSNETPIITLDLPDSGLAMSSLRFTDENSRPSERDAFHFAMLSRDFIRALDPGFYFTDFPMSIVVERPLGEPTACNAFWDGPSIQFFEQGSNCANSARVATVVMHEYGHAVTGLMYYPFYPSGAMHEGFSDYLACTMTNQPVVGPHFYDVPGRPHYIRRIDDDRVFPDDATGGSHNDGLIIASTLWDLREILGASLVDSLWHYARYGYSDNFDDYFLDFLLTDDDNGNIYDGTPHFGPIVDRFRAHGIGDYSIRVSHVPERDTEDLSRMPTLRASFLSVFPLVGNSARIHLEIEIGGVTTPLELVMTPTGGVREYEYELPVPPAGTEVRYWFTAADTAGGSVVWPPHGGDDPFVFRVGTDLEPPTIVHTRLDDQPVNDDSRPVLADVTDNLDRGLGVVRLIHRRNDADSTAVDMTGPAPGFRSSLPTTGLVVGDIIDYRIEAADSAMTPNIGRSPSAGWNQFRIAGGVGRDFELDAGGAVGGGDWQWGVPGFDLVPPSGQKVWGTELTGIYNDRLASTLEFAPVDLSGFESGTLSFQHHLDCEFFYDGGIIESSRDGGATWQLLTPDGDYTIPRVAASNLPGFSGTLDGWQTVEADLSAWAGNPAFRMRLRFFADAGVAGPGWYIDDLKIVDRRARLRPLLPTAESDPAGNVSVAWSLPPGYQESPAGPVIGYHVYRATRSQDNPVRLTDEPVTMRAFQDSGLPDNASWDYYVTALYASGESRRAGPATASRVQPVYAGDWTLMEAEVDSGAVLDTLLIVGNMGTGQLRVNSYAGRSGQDVDDLRIRMSLKTFGADWDTLFLDPSESDTLAADLRLIEVRQTADSLLYRLTTWRPWGDPLVDFSMAVELDLDDDITTGPRGDLFGLIGARALALVGEPQALFAHSGGSSYIHAGSLLVWHAVSGGQSAIIGFDKTGGQAPPEVRVVTRVYDGESAITEDRAPDVVSHSWLALGTRHLEIDAGETANLAIRLGGPGVPPGLVSGAIILDTSDPVNPGITLPVVLQVSSVVSVVLGRFTATPVPAGLELVWTTVEALDHLGFRLARRSVSPLVTEEVMVGPGLIRADEDGSTWRFVDTAVLPGHQYEYRLADVSRSGQVEWHGPFAVTMPGVAVPLSMQLSPAVPNPAPGATTIAFAIPAPAAVELTLFSVDGRTVRRLLRHARHDAGWHDAAWDGRDDAGNPVPSGVYFYRLESAGRVASRKLLLVR